VMAPGWYWLRALLPLVPVGALLTGLALETAFKWSDQYVDSGGFKSLGAGLWRPAVGAIGVVSALTSLSLSFAGPNQETWTPSLGQSADFLRSVRNLGSPQSHLLSVYHGDYECWQWLNGHVGPSDRIATFELRLYYFDRPQNLFYLDGLEAVPLLHLDSPDSVREYLTEHNVRYIMIPAWAIADTPARHPAVDLLPMMKMLGRTDGFRLVATWGQTAVYEVNP